MKQTDAEAGGRRSLLSWASRIASATAALLLVMGSGAKADVIETFSLSGDLNTFIGAPVAFTGSMNLDFSDDFSSYAAQSLEISVQGSVFTLSPSVALSTSTSGTIRASDSADDMLTLLFATPLPGAWTGFDTGQIFFGYLVFGGETETGLLGADGYITRTSGPEIIDPPPPVLIDPPPPPSVPVPELSTWTMMLVGLAGLGLAAKGRRALAFRGGRA